MKKYACLINIFFLLLLSSMLWAENDIQKFERNLNERAQLITAYDSIKNQFKDSTWFNIRDLALLQARLIQKDKYIINELLPVLEDFKALETAHDELSKKHSTVENTLKEKEQWIEWGIYGGAGLAFLFLLFLILFIVKVVSGAKLKKKIKSMERLHEQYQEKLEEMNAIVANESKIVEIEAAYNKIIEDNKNNFEQEKRDYNNKLLDAQNSLAHIKNELLSKQEENNQLKSYNEHLEQKIAATENNISNNNEEELNNRIAELQKEIEEKENYLTENYKEEKTHLSDEIIMLKRQAEEDKHYIQEQKMHIENLHNEISALKDRQDADTPIKDNEIPQDMQIVFDENKRMKAEIEEYKNIINEELEFRKDILKLIEDLKKK